MLQKLTEQHLNPPPVALTGHGSAAEGGSSGTEPVVGDGVGVGVTELGDSTALGVDARSGQAGFRPGRGGFGYGQVGFGGGQPGGGVSGGRGSGYIWNAAGKGIQPNMGLGKENLGVGSRDLRKLE